MQAGTTCSGTGPNLNRDVPGGKFGMAFGAHHDRVEQVAALLVPVKQRAACTPRHVYVAPMNDRHQDRMQIPAFRRQAVLIARRRLLISHFFQHFLIDQFAQPINQHWPGNSQALLEIFKPPYSQETISKDE